MKRKEVSVATEITIRKELHKIFNKTKDDFETIREFNDYLELVEDITYNKIYKIDPEETQKRISKYQQENDRIIEINEKKRQEYMKKEEQEINQEKIIYQQKLLKYKDEDEKERQILIEQKMMEIDKLNGKTGEKSLLKRLRKTERYAQDLKKPKFEFNSDIGTIQPQNEKIDQTYQITNQRTIYFPLPPPKVVASDKSKPVDVEKAAKAAGFVDTDYRAKAVKEFNSSLRIHNIAVVIT